MKQSERLKIYEQFFHQINVYCVTMNQEKVAEAVALIDKWSYAHRMGNGELTDQEQKKVVESVIEKMRNFK